MIQAPEVVRATGKHATHLDALVVGFVGVREVIDGVVEVLLVCAGLFGDPLLDVADLWVLGEGVGLCEERHGGSRMVLGCSTVVLGDAVEDVLCTRVEARFMRGVKESGVMVAALTEDDRGRAP